MVLDMIGEYIKMSNNITKEEVVRELIEKRHWSDEEIGQTLDTIDELEKGITHDGYEDNLPDKIRDKRIALNKEDLKRIIKELKVNEYCLQILQGEEYIPLSDYYEEYA